MRDGFIGVLTRGAVLLSLSAEICACGPLSPIASNSASRGQGAVPMVTPRARATSASGAAPPAAGTVPADHDVLLSRAEAAPALAIFDRETLQILEQHGFDFGAFALGEKKSAASLRQTAAELFKHSDYAALVATLTADLAEIARRDASAGVGMKNAHRLFDAGWLRSPEFYFELVAVVNRMDRRVFAPGTCGELRLVYRLAYETTAQGQRVKSRLPMTVNVVRHVLEKSCQEALSRWRLPSRIGALAAAALTAAQGPLGEKALSATSLKSVEVNLQSVRWPSTVRPNMGGHAEYLLRVFRKAGAEGSLIPAPMENTPDLPRLGRDPALRAELLAWLGRAEVLRAVDEGTVQLPERFLAKQAVSAAPHGLARLSNRPFTQLYGTETFTTLDFSSLKHGTVRNSRELLRRLDGLSCQGCHQSRSAAGFHVLGNDDPAMKADALSTPHSPHFTDDMRRRNEYARQWLLDQSPSEFRPFAERVLAQDGWGAHCGLLPEIANSPFASWGCASGLRCLRVNDSEIGQCMPIGPTTGDACELGVMHENAVASRDTVALMAPRSCGPGRVCERNGVGFPGGMCAGACETLPADATCGEIAVLSGFNSCLARRQTFERCVLENSRPGALRRCSHSEPCRDDYICARTSGGEGACLPPYFLFQLRVDGHVLQP